VATNVKEDASPSDPSKSGSGDKYADIRKAGMREALKVVDDAETTLAHFAATLSFEDIPQPVLRRAEDLLLDWLGSALAGKGVRPVETIERFALRMGPAGGDSEVLITRRCTSPLFAAMVNAASSHVAEQDDIHNGAVFHPASVVCPPALAVAQAFGRAGSELLTAAVADYEVGVRVGEFLGQPHYKVFHTTGTAGALASAAAVGWLLRVSSDQMLEAFGSAGTQAAGLWEFLRDGADSKPLHTAHASASGLTAAFLAQDGFTGAKRILTGAQGMAAGMSRDADPARLIDRLGDRWAVVETSFKYHASCRHTHPAADALLLLVETLRCRRPKSCASPRTFIRRPLMCLAQWSIRKRYIRPSSPWASCSASSRRAIAPA
jgi:2-methylcitrate dehydratase PrpD